MTTRFSLTITTSNTDGETKAAECAEIAHMLDRVAHQVRSTYSTSGTIANDNGVGTATYTYTATAAK